MISFVQRKFGLGLRNIIQFGVKMPRQSFFCDSCHMLVQSLRCFASISLRNNAERLGAWSLTAASKRTQRDIEVQTGGSEGSVVSQITALGKQRRWTEIEEVFRSSKQTSTIYTAAISAAKNCGQFSIGLFLFSEMKARGIKRSALTYTAAMAIHSHEGNEREVRCLLDEMLTQSEAPSLAALTVAFTTLTNVLAVHGNVAAIQSSFQDMGKYGIQPNQAHYGCLLKACRNAGDLAMATRILEEMRSAKMQVNVVHYTLVMATLRTTSLALRQPDDAQQRIASLLTWMADDAVSPNRYFAEELLAAHVVQDLKSFCIHNIPTNHVKDIVGAAIASFEKDELSNIELTRMRKRTLHRLS